MKGGCKKYKICFPTVYTETPLHRWAPGRKWEQAVPSGVQCHTDQCLRRVTAATGHMSLLRLRVKRLCVMTEGRVGAAAGGQASLQASEFMPCAIKTQLHQTHNFHSCDPSLREKPATLTKLPNKLKFSHLSASKCKNTKFTNHFFNNRLSGRGLSMYFVMVQIKNKRKTSSYLKSWAACRRYPPPPSSPTFYHD